MSFKNKSKDKIYIIDDPPSKIEKELAKTMIELKDIFNLSNNDIINVTKDPLYRKFLNRIYQKK